MSENQQQPYVIVEWHGSGLAAFFLGTAVGAAVALLFAPKSGEETQQDLREGARRLRDEGRERLDDIRSGVEEGYERARSEVEEKVDAARDSVRDRRHRAEEALKAGKDAAARARSDLERRVAESKAEYRAALDGEGDGEAEDEGAGDEDETSG